MEWKLLVCWLLAAVPQSGWGVPDTCKTTFDAVAGIRGELFFFKDHHFWRLTRHGHLMTRKPVPRDTFWQGLPKDSKVDAVYERPDGQVVFFSGRYFWVVWERSVLAGYPRPLSDLGLPEETPAVDAAFASSHNSRTYLITGAQYWRFNELTGRVEADSPLSTSRLCRGLPRQLDAAFVDARGDAYFLQGQHYWRCDWARATVQSYAPDLVAPRWLGCSLVECCLPDLYKQMDEEVWPGMREGLVDDDDEGLEGKDGAGAQEARAALFWAGLVWGLVWTWL